MSLRVSSKLRAVRGGVGLVLLGFSACAGSLVERRIDELRATLVDAERRGAASCAPVELALCSVHLEFAQLELREGDEQRAERHLILAEPNGKAALRRTKEGDCHPSAESAGTHAAAADSSQAAGASGSKEPRTERASSTTSRSSRVATAQGHGRTER